MTIPSALRARHRDRVQTLLDDVPRDLSVPNEAIEVELREERSRVAESLASGFEEGESELDRLAAWRRLREDAAQVRGAYRAATGTDDGDRVRNARQALREEWGQFVGTQTYRAPDPVEALGLYAPLEELAWDAHGELRPARPYPAEPQAAVFAAGEATAAVERGRADLADAAALRTAYHDAHGDAPSQWEALTAGADWLHHRYRATIERVDQYQPRDPDVDVFDRDLSETPAESLYLETALAVRWRAETIAEVRARDATARAVLEIGRGVVEIDALDAVATNIRDGSYQSTPTAEEVRTMATEAETAIRSALETEPRGLATELCWPALDRYHEGVEQTTYSDRSPDNVFAAVVAARHYARAVPAAVSFVTDELDRTA